jgi:redox-sensitive bicupin YhaK (pirin superfamily)
MRLKQGKSAKLSLPEGWNTLLIVLHGTVMVNGSTLAREAQLVVFDHPGTTLRIEANNDATLLLLSGEPIDEPIVGYGPFVMNSEQEIAQTISDFNSGHFGQIPR